MNGKENLDSLEIKKGRTKFSPFFQPAIMKDKLNVKDKRYKKMAIRLTSENIR